MFTHRHEGELLAQGLDEFVDNAAVSFSDLHTCCCKHLPHLTQFQDKSANKMVLFYINNFELII